MNEDISAEALARWLAAGAEGDPPEGLDPEVLEAVYAVRPDLAPAPRLDLDALMDSVQTGPFAEAEASGPGGAGAMGTEAPEEADGAGTDGSGAGGEVVPFPGTARDDAGAAGSAGTAGSATAPVQTRSEGARSTHDPGRSTHDRGRARRPVWLVPSVIGTLAAAAAALLVLLPETAPRSMPEGDAVAPQAVQTSADRAAEVEAPPPPAPEAAVPPAPSSRTATRRKGPAPKAAPRPPAAPSLDALEGDAVVELEPAEAGEADEAPPQDLAPAPAREAAPRDKKGSGDVAAVFGDGASGGAGANTASQEPIAEVPAEDRSIVAQARAETDDDVAARRGDAVAALEEEAEVAEEEEADAFAEPLGRADAVRSVSDAPLSDDGAAPAAPSAEADEPPPAGGGVIGGLVAGDDADAESVEAEPRKSRRARPRSTSYDAVSRSAFVPTTEGADAESEAEPVPQEGAATSWRTGLSPTQARALDIALAAAAETARTDPAAAAKALAPSIQAPARAGQHVAAQAVRYALAADDPTLAVALADQGLALGTDDTPERRTLQALRAAAARSAP